MKRIAPLLTVSLLLAFVSTTTAFAKDKSGGNYGSINIGPTGIVGYFKDKSPHFTVIDVAKDSPANGKIRKDDVITAVNGKALDGYPVKGEYPKLWYAKKGSRYVLGSAITKAEASDGALTFKVKRGSGNTSVTVKIPTMGTYSQTWPINCKKSDKIAQDIADFLVRIQDREGKFVFPKVDLPKGMAGREENNIGHVMAGLFLLSMGTDKHLAAAKKFAQQLCSMKHGTSTWQLGYKGMFLGEYYLRTGDQEAKKSLAVICRMLQENDKVGSWPHKIDVINSGYVRGGLMNQAGVNCFKTYLLARECGIKVDEAAFLRTLHFFYKFAGKGSTPYGDHRPRVGGDANGKGPSTVCTYTLMDDKRATRAAQMGAVTAIDTYYVFETGHTGNGFNIMWRGIAAAHIPKEFDSRRQQCMNALTWYYDLARGHDGSMRILPVPEGATRYASTCWGTGALGLHYTAHRKTLRITGKPRGARNANPKLPPDAAWRWYEKPDTDFLKVGFCKGGKDIKAKTQDYHQMENPTVAECELLMRHYDPAIRKMFAHKLSQIGSGKTISPAALDAIERALRGPDQRVQRAATDAISGYHPWSSIGKKIPTLVSAKDISKRFAPYLIKILADKNADIWLKDGALWAMARAKATTIEKNLSLIASYDDHRIWWLRQAARWRVWGLVQDKRVTYATLEQILAAKKKYGRSFPAHDLKKNMAMCIEVGDFTATERKTIIKTMMEDLKGKATKPLDAYGYRARVSGYSSKNVCNFYQMISGFTPEEHAMTYPFLIGYIDSMVTDDTPIYMAFGMMFYGVKRYKGIMRILMAEGKKSRPAMARLKTFLYSKEKDIARAKYEPEKPYRRKKSYDPYIEQLKKSVAEWEEKFGKL